MENKLRESIEELGTIVDRIDWNHMGWKSIFRRKKYANLKFAHSVKNIVAMQQEIIEYLSEEMEKSQQRLEKCALDIEEMKQQQKEQEKEWEKERGKEREEDKKNKEQLEKQLGATSRQLMKIKWHLIDGECKYLEKPEDILHCKICGYESERKNYETKETECRFNGGKLVRYVCPGCGVIFGPTKFSALTQDEINDDYTTHYLGFHEGDSTQKELDAFYMLKPDKKKIYLNYGCGSWSKSLKLLREQGYQVFGYEPYAPETDNPYMITSRDAIQKMRFDGIYSNDVIEHFVTPVEDFIFMRELLKDRYSTMAHSTSCYIYKHEVTRFHTHFFTGKSIEVLCERAGFDIIERVNEVDTKDFICYVYRPKMVDMDYTSKLCGLKRNENRAKDKAEKRSDYILEPEGTMYGPYLTLGGGHYRWQLQLEGIVDGTCRITEQAGKETLKTVKVTDGNNIIEIDIPQIIIDLEFVIDNHTGREITIKKLEMLETEK